MALVPLSQLKDYHLVNEKQNVHGWRVRGAAGDDLGRVADMIVDTDERRVSTLKLDTGRWIPVKDVTLGDGIVTLEDEAKVEELRASAGP